MFIISIDLWDDEAREEARGMSPTLRTGGSPFTSRCYAYA